MRLKRWSRGSSCRCSHPFAQVCAKAPGDPLAYGKLLVGLRKRASAVLVALIVEIGPEAERPDRETADHEHKQHARGDPAPRSAMLRRRLLGGPTRIDRLVGGTGHAEDIETPGQAATSSEVG
jgi:hypothetical protein